MPAFCFCDFAKARFLNRRFCNRPFGGEIRRWYFLGRIQARSADSSEPFRSTMATARALFEALDAVDLAPLRVLLGTGANPDLRNSEGDTALIVAALRGASDAADLLLRHGADINAQGMFDRSALLEAVTRRRYDCIKLLLVNGADPNLVDQTGSG